MSHHSLYESKWINLVFENRNKEYGAFQLRKETTKTSFQALSLGILLCTSLIVLPNLISHPSEITIPSVPDWSETVIQLQDIYSSEKEEAPAPALSEVKAQTPIDVIDKKQLINPVVVSAPQANADVEFTMDKPIPKDNSTDGIAIAGSSTGTADGVVNGTGIGNGTAVGNGTDGTSSEIVINEMLDKKPQFPGGIEKFYRYVGNNFRSPVLDETKNVRIYVSFIVEKDGSMSSIKVLNKPGQALEKEAIRVLNSIKVKWTPGIYNSKPVRTAYNLPITVQVN